MKTLLKNCKIVNHDKITEGNILINGNIIEDITNEDVYQKNRIHHFLLNHPFL